MATGNQKLILYGLGALVAYYLIKNLPGAITRAAKEALQAAGERVGETVFNWFNPDPVGETTFYMVWFPNGSRHSVPSRSVDAQGRFRYALPPQTERTYRIAIDVKTRQKHAIPIG